MQDNLIRRVRDYIAEYDLISAGDSVCVGLSGGADSVCLLFMLRELAPELHFDLQAVHVDHQLRGEESDGDRQYAAELCRRWQIPLEIFKCDVRAEAEKAGIGLEEAGRCRRHMAFRRMQEQYGASKIALAHHANDLAETMLFRMARGTSLSGLAGIRPESRIGRKNEKPLAVIHPLLCVERREIEAFLTERGICWRTDSTNRDTTYARNGIRGVVIPRLEQNVNSAAVRHMAELSSDLADAEDFLEVETAARVEALARRTDRGIYLSEKILLEPRVFKGRIILSCLAELAGTPKDLGKEAVRQVLGLFSGRAGSRADLPGGLFAVREYGEVRISGEDTGNRDRTSAAEMAGGTLPAGIRIGEGSELAEQKRVEFRFGPCLFRCRIVPYSPEILETARTEKKQFTKFFDYDKINVKLLVRFRQPGDYLVTTASGGRKKLKDYLIDEKVPRDERGEIPLLVSGSEVIWVVGHRIGETGKVSRETRRVLVVEAAHSF